MQDSTSQPTSDNLSDPPPAPLSPTPTQNPTASTQNPLDAARAAHTKLSNTARLLSDALLARTESRLADDPTALDTEQIATGVKILQDLVSIEKTLLSNLMLIDHLEKPRTPAPPTPSSAVASAQEGPTPTTPPSAAAPSAAALSAVASAKAEANEEAKEDSSFPPAPLSSFAIRNSLFISPSPLSSFVLRPSSFIPYKFLAQNPHTTSNSAPRNSTLTLPLACVPAVPAVPECPRLSPQLLHQRLRTLDHRIMSFPSRPIPPAIQNFPLPDYNKPAPDYEPPPDNRWGVGKPHPTLRPDPDNPGRFRWVHPRPKRSDTS